MSVEAIDSEASVDVLTVDTHPEKWNGRLVDL